MKDSSAYALPASSFAPQAMGAKVILSKRNTVRIIQGFDQSVKLLAALGTGGFVGWFSAWATSLVVDDTYATLERMGVHTTSHGVFVAMALWFFMVPFLSCLAFGCLRKLWKGNSLWNIAPVLLVVGLGAADFVLEGAWQDVLQITPWLALALISAIAGMRIGQKSIKCAR
jgi:hypothetical protein